MRALNAHRGEVEFDLFVDAPGFETIKPGDVYLRFTTDDLARISAEAGVESIQEIAAKIQKGSIQATLSALRYGLKTCDEGGKERKFVVNPSWLNDTPFAIGVATVKVGDALVWNLYGKTAVELMKEFTAAQSKTAEGDDDTAPFRSSTGSLQTEL